jgi:hypothetical protein
MSSSYLLNLKINSLQSQLDALSVYTGYTYELISTGGGTVDGNSFFAPQGNNTAYAYSSVQRDEPWTITFSVPNVPGNDMFVGITQDITQTFPNPSSPSMAAVEYGLLIDTNNNQGLFKIIDGQYSTTGYDIGTYYKMVYNGSVISVSIDNIQLYTYPVTLQGVNIVVGSFAGGQINNIVFDGVSTGGGSGSNQNLQQVLAIGNNAGNEDILNVGNFTANKYINIGNQISNSSQLHFYYANGTETGNNFQLVADGTSGGQLAVQFYTGTTFNNSPVLIRSGGVIVQGSMSAHEYGVNYNGQDGVVFDSLVNLPNVVFNSTVSNATSKIYPTNTATSIYQFDIAGYNEMLNNFTMYFKSLAFQFDVTGGSNANAITVQFFLSDTLNGDFDATNPLNISWTSGNLNIPTGGNPNVNTSKVILGLLSDATPLVDGIYLNVKTTSTDPSNTFQLSNLSFETQLTAGFLAVKSFTPQLLS